MDSIPTPLTTELATGYATLGLFFTISLFSIAGFTSRKFYFATILHPATIRSGSHSYRILLSGFVHSGIQNLLFNSFILLDFGLRLEYFLSLHSRYGHFEILLIFFAGIIASNLISLAIHRNEVAYSSTGSSAGILALVIDYLLYNPREQLMVIPFLKGISNWLVVPVYIAGLLYLTWKRSGERISHELHLLGSIAGVLTILILHPVLLNQIFMKRSASQRNPRSGNSYHKPAQFGPVAAATAPTTAPTPPKRPPTVAPRPIEAAHVPESMPPSRASISSVVYVFIKKDCFAEHHCTAIQNSADCQASGNPTGFNLNLLGLAHH
jgi:membrane associated rhomboid family serine protease